MWLTILLQRHMQEENLKKQEESVQKQEAMRRGQVVGCFYAYIVVDDECVTMHCVDFLADIQTL